MKSEREARQMCGVVGGFLVAFVLGTALFPGDTFKVLALAVGGALLGFAFVR